MPSHSARRFPRFERDSHAAGVGLTAGSAMLPHPFRRLYPKQPVPELIRHLFLGHNPLVRPHLHITSRRERAEGKVGEIKIGGPLLEAALWRQDADLFEFIISKLLKVLMNWLHLIGGGCGFRRLGLSQADILPGHRVRVEIVLIRLWMLMQGLRLWFLSRHYTLLSQRETVFTPRQPSCLV
jgi:hypothetical protein